MLSSPVRSVSTCSSLPLLVLSSGQSVVAELSQAFQCQQSAFRQEFASELLHFSLLTPHAGVLPFGGFSMLLEEITRGSFCGLIAIPPASTWSRARNSGVQGPPSLRSRDSPLGIQGLSPKFLDQVKEHNQALEFCVMALDKWCQSFPLRPFFFVAPEGPASIWQLAEVMAIVQRTREAVRSSAFACELRAADSPRPLAFISNLSQLGSGVVQGWPRLRQKETSCNTLALSLTIVLVASSIRNYLELGRKESLRQGCLHCSQWISGQRCWSQQARPLGME